GLAGELRRDPRVEEPDGAKAIVAVEHAQIVIGVVEGFFDLWISQQAAERLETRRGDGHGIDDGRLGWTRDLEEVDAVAVAMEAGRFGIDADPVLASRGGDERRQLGRRV